MKISSTFHVSVFLMAFLIFSMPFLTLAQQNLVPEEIAAAAEADANKDVNKLLWFGTGCLLSGLMFFPLPARYSLLLPPAGLTGTYFYQPDPPVARLIGKSPDYVRVYTSTYKSKRGRTQALWASAGCISGGVVVGAVAFGIGVGVWAVAASQE